jgi:hypothetical protein
MNRLYVSMWKVQTLKMRVRAMTASGDATFGRGSANFLVNSPAAVAQLVLVRFKLWAGQWFLDLSAGVPWMTQVLGSGTKPLYDSVIRSTAAQTPGVVGIVNYSSSVEGRALTINTTIVTLFSTSLLNLALFGTADSDNGNVAFTVNY